MTTICVTTQDGVSERISAVEGETLMSALKRSGQDVAATCGGHLLCGTCHVYIDGYWPSRLDPPTPEELELVDQLVYSRPESRISCQVIVNPSVDGLLVTLAPPE